MCLREERSTAAMIGGQRSSIKRYVADFRPFFADYKSSILAWGSGIVGTVLWIASSIFGSTAILVTAGAVYIVPAVGYYFAYRPFGINIDLTPMVNGESPVVPDKVAEGRGEAVLRGGECEIHGGVNISEKLDSFEIQFSVPDDLRVELIDIPCKEHQYERESNTLSVSTISVRRFSFVLLVYLVGEEDGMTHEFPLRIQDKMNDRTIETIDVVTR